MGAADQIQGRAGRRGLAVARVWAASCVVARDGTVIVGRSMDWGEDMMSNMWVLPRSIDRDGLRHLCSAKAASRTWVRSSGPRGTPFGSRFGKSSVATRVSR